MGLAAYKNMYDDIVKAIKFLRENEHTIPDKSLEFIKHAAVKRLNEIVIFDDERSIG